VAAKRFSDLRTDLYDRNPQSHRRVAAEAERLREQLNLAELRTRTDRTQVQIAELIGTSQSGVSRLERQRDVLVTTLADYVAATGGRLRLIAQYPDFEAEICLPGARAQPEPRHKPRSFHVIWQDVRTRQLVDVGRLTFDGRHFTFEYTPDAELHADFEPFPAFPDFDEVYESDTLFPYFAQRTLSAAQSGYEGHLAALGLTRSEATPVELLARSWGTSPHDTIQIVPEPTRHEDGTEVMTFLVSGVRHVDEDNSEHISDRIARLHTGQQLTLQDEPDNPYNEQAISLEADGQPVGWMPDYLLDYVHKNRSSERRIRVAVEQANGPSTPWHLRLLCRLIVEHGQTRK